MANAAYARHGEAWLDDEDRRLHSEFVAGLSVLELAERLQRPPQAIAFRLHGLGLITASSQQIEPAPTFSGFCRSRANFLPGLFAEYAHVVPRGPRSSTRIDQAAPSGVRNNELLQRLGMIYLRLITENTANTRNAEILVQRMGLVPDLIPIGIHELAHAHGMSTAAISHIFAEWTDKLADIANPLSSLGVELKNALAAQAFNFSKANDRLLFHSYLDGHLASRRQHGQWAAIAYIALGHSCTFADGFNLAGRGIAQLKRWQKRWPESRFKEAAE